MAEKVYLVQTWDEAGVLSNNYETVIHNDRELGELKKFLKSKHGHVIVSEAKKRVVARKRGS